MVVQFRGQFAVAPRRGDVTSIAGDDRQPHVCSARQVIREADAARSQQVGRREVEHRPILAAGGIRIAGSEVCLRQPQPHRHHAGLVHDDSAVAARQDLGVLCARRGGVADSQVGRCRGFGGIAQGEHRRTHRIVAMGLTREVELGKQ